MVRVGQWILSAKKRSTSISPDRRTVYSFDLEGRPVSWFQYGHVYKRSLAGDIFGRTREEERKRYWQLPAEEAAALLDAMRRTVQRAPTRDLPEPLPARLEGILRWTPDLLFAERERFKAAYVPISILPPDQYLSIVLQATRGCTWNRCTFCNFYQDREFEVSSKEDFAQHCETVRSFLGRGAELRRSIFLADGNALNLSNGRLEPLFEIARTTFPNRSISGFVDLFTGERKTAADWAEMAKWGLWRLCIGLESGDDRLLRWLNKPGDADSAPFFIATLKEAGLKVSIVLMIGIGGKRFAADHIENSLKMMERLPLEEGDIVYLSPFRERSGTSYAERAAGEMVEPLDRREREAQYRRMRDAVRRMHPGVRVTRYDILEFVY
jgi:radical SAM superfamily enzyme YgiQ (UPF0313 family)